MGDTRSTQAVERFDSQAATFDDRAGLSDDVAAAVASSVIDIGGAGRDDLVLEIGAGTGEIGRHLLGAVRYLGIDRSAEMLELFRGKIGNHVADAELVHGDADEDWPAPDGSVAVVFGSRVMHLLDRDHLATELRRVLHPGGAMLVGRVTRDPDSARSRLRKERQRVLRDHGIEPRQAEKVTASLLAGLVASGATPIDTRPVATWTVTVSPEEVLDRWSTLTSMGGVELSSDVRQAILARLWRWAEEELGDLSTASSSVETYTIGGVRLGAASIPSVADTD